jgi:hypothetical protein
MIRHTLLPRCGSFEVINDTDLCIIYHLMTKTPLNLCYVMIQYMIDQCFSIKQKVVGIPYGMNLTPIFKAAKISFDREQGQNTFMKFTAKTISQLRITSTNMPIPQKSRSVEEPSKDIRVDENIEQHAQKVDDDTREVVEILVSNAFGSENQQMEVDEGNTKFAGERGHIVNEIDLNIEDFGSDLNNDVF